MGKEADGRSYCCFWFILCCTVRLQWKARSGRIHKGNSSAGALCLPQDWPFRWSWVGLRVCFPFDLNNREQPHNVKRNILSRIVLYIGCSFPTEIDKLILVSLLGCRGFPFWLHDVPGIVFRTDNEPFKVLQSSHVMTVGPSQVISFTWFFLAVLHANLYYEDSELNEVGGSIRFPRRSHNPIPGDVLGYIYNVRTRLAEMKISSSYVRQLLSTSHVTFILMNWNLTDREWIPEHWSSLSRARAIVCSLGSKHGSWARDRGSMGHVQAGRCSWSCG